MSKVGMGSPALKALKSQYLAAEKVGDKSKMAKLKSKAMQEMQKVKSEASKVTNVDGDILDISDEGLTSQKINSEDKNLEDKQIDDV
jgi:hypothetical protein